MAAATHRAAGRARGKISSPRQKANQAGRKLGKNDTRRSGKNASLNRKSSRARSSKDSEAQNQGVPTPDPAVRRLNRLVGRWNLKGRPVDSDQDTITGTATFKWLHGDGDENDTGFFLQQDMEMNYDGTVIRSRELIGYNPKTKTFASQVYSNMAPDPWPYAWDIQGDTWTISIKHGPMNAKFTGKFSPDGNGFSGGWRPNPGADKTVNAPYDIAGIRAE